MIDLDFLINTSYIIASILFIFGLKMLSSATTARRGNCFSALGMLIAIVATLLYKGMDYEWIIVGFVIGGLIGVVAAVKVKMTSMPEMVALFNGFGGLASLLVAWSQYHSTPHLPLYTIIPLFLTILIGAVTFSGSMFAFGKLGEYLTSRPILFPGQKIINAILPIIIVGLGVVFCIHPEHAYPLFLTLIALSLILGLLVVIPIGGADMPVVISLLNSYSGLAASAAGFVINNNVLIVSGSLVGASGLVLTNIMCKAMNRSLANVFFAGVGATNGKGASHKGEAKTVTPNDAYFLLEAAHSVVFVPGYGMAIAQAQHVVKELADLLQANGTDVTYAIHPVAGRMPGHMNVLLAEAGVPYEQLIEPKDVNPRLSTVDVCVVIGANDVVNPAARDQKDSPIYGMPIINVDEAKTVIVLKRSLAAGFAGVDNPLFFFKNTCMLLGDAKTSVQAMVSEFKE
ncbi:MAG: NAD(P) transhydrogenase subunit beta [Chlamydiae bacterium]|nr:NAD(P) transhydrogenase subunit beta [Chlamydiota bacterium]